MYRDRYIFFLIFYSSTRKKERKKEREREINETSEEEINVFRNHGAEIPEEYKRKYQTRSKVI